MPKNINIMSDEELLQEFSKSKNEYDAAFSVIYSRHSSRIYLYCRKVLGESNYCDDIFQETFIKFYNAATSGYNIPSVQFYLLKIARNLCINIKKKNISYVEIEDFHLPYEEFTVENSELNKLVNMGLELLPDMHKEAFILQAFQGLSYSEIAAVLDVPVTTVRNWIVRAKSKLREILLPYFESYRIEKENNNESK